MFDDRLNSVMICLMIKRKNFDGNFSPRLSLVYSAGESRRHNLEVHFKTGSS
jgi:hypothetical protein